MDQILPPKSDPPMPRIPPQSNPPKLELLMQDLGDEEPTLKMKVPPHLLWESGKYHGPNYGMIGAILFCLAFWGSIGYLIFR